MEPTVFGKNKDFILNTLTKEVIREALILTQKEFFRIFNGSECFAFSFRTALKSDMVSTTFGFFLAETIRKRFGYTVTVSGNDDTKPDLYIHEARIPLEIKATTGSNWTGGEFSDRPYPTILVSYDLHKGEYFVCLLPKITKWESNIERKRYGTRLSWKTVRSAHKYILYGCISRVSPITNKVIKGDLFRTKI